MTGRNGDLNGAVWGNGGNATRKSHALFCMYQLPSTRLPTLIPPTGVFSSFKMDVHARGVALSNPGAVHILKSIRPSDLTPHSTDATLSTPHAIQCRYSVLLHSQLDRIPFCFRVPRLALPTGHPLSTK